jgi:hypothetical protein
VAVVSEVPDHCREKVFPAIDLAEKQMISI